jgi:H+/Na+-translocating ferredoxin:NAD+ oxidoreductase subunit G
MKESIQMVVVLSLICAVCALGLSGFRSFTAERIVEQILENVQGPKVNIILDGSDNDLLADRKTLPGDDAGILFLGKKDGKVWGIAYETQAEGFDGPISVMVGYNLGTNKIAGLQIISHTETPGIGSRVTEDTYTSKFNGLGLGLAFKTKGDGGDIDGVTGATYSSRGVCEALALSVEKLPEMKKFALEQ